MQYFSILCKYYFYAYYQKTCFKSSCPVNVFCSEQQQGSAVVKTKLDGTLYMWHRYVKLVLKQIVKLLIVVIMLNLRIPINEGYIA